MMKRKSKLLITLFGSFFLFLGILLFNSAKWYTDIYGDTGFDSIIYTLFSGADGIEKGFLKNYIINALIPTVIYSVLIGFLIFLTAKKRVVVYIADKIKFTLYPFPKIVALILSITVSSALIYSASDKAGLIEYIGYVSQKSTVFQDYYVNPKDIKITFPSQKRNLIYIYLESMETTFLSYELGGGNDINAIPELYELANTNTNFSHNKSVGGFNALSGSSWTIGAMVSQTAGVPLKTPINLDGNDYGQEGEFLSGITSLSDVLNENGYYQALMVGSDASYGGRRQYYEQHGTDRIYDIFTAREDGIIPEDYCVWWGMEDLHLFEYAKKELSAISKLGEPFAFTMLTVDTHHIDGYKCAACGNEYAEQYENVLACSSKQVYEFVEWISKQDFFENTTVIICGDHPTMDSRFIRDNITDDYDRRVYNCFINTAVSTDNTRNREFCTYDLFPTTLSALGCRVEGDRLGLGTDLFSDTPTLCEALGTDTFNAEVSKYSVYYANNFY